MPDPLDAAVIRTRLADLEGWSFDDDKLHKEFSFEGFSPAFGFVCQIALLAQGQNHHPSVCHSYATVTVETWSHDAGGVTERDLKLASAIDDL